MSKTILAAVVTVLGGVALAAGVALIYPPAGVIVAGVLMLAAGLFAIDVG